MSERRGLKVRYPSDTALEHTDDLHAGLRELDRHRRLQCPGEAPVFVVAAAIWAVEMLYAASQFMVYRDINADIVTTRLKQPCPAKRSAAVDYSVDLVFAALPDLIPLARGISGDDPLTVGLRNLAKEWPLSSVGVSDVGPVDIGPFASDACLMQMYVDRIIQRRDLQRMDNPAVREMARDVIGAYPDLAPLIAAELREKGSDVV